MTDMKEQSICFKFCFKLVEMQQIKMHFWWWSYGPAWCLWGVIVHFENNTPVGSIFKTPFILIQNSLKFIQKFSIICKDSQYLWMFKLMWKYELSENFLCKTWNVPYYGKICFTMSMIKKETQYSNNLWRWYKTSFHRSLQMTKHESCIIHN